MSDVEYGVALATGQVIPLRIGSERWFTVTADNLRVRSVAAEIAEWRLPTRDELVEKGLGAPVDDQPDSNEQDTVQPPPPVTVTRQMAIRKAAGAVLACEHIARTMPPRQFSPDLIATQLQAAQVWATIAVGFLDDKESYTIDLTKPDAIAADVHREMNGKSRDLRV